MAQPSGYVLVYVSPIYIILEVIRIPILSFSSNLITIKEHISIPIYHHSYKSHNQIEEFMIIMSP